MFCNSICRLWACFSKHEKAGKGKAGEKCFSINFFCVYSVHGWWHRSACVHILCGLSTCVLLCKVDILFARVWKHLMSVFMWVIGGSAIGLIRFLRGFKQPHITPHRWNDSPLFFFTIFSGFRMQYMSYNSIQILVSSRLNRSWCDGHAEGTKDFNIL